MCNIDPGSAASPASGTFRTSAASVVGVIREQLLIFLADTLQGTAEERAPLVLTMSQPGAGNKKAVPGQQVTEVSHFLFQRVCWFIIYRCLSFISVLSYVDLNQCFAGAVLFLF